MRALLVWLGVSYGVGSTYSISLQDPLPLQQHFTRTLKDYKGLRWDTITKENAAPPVRVRNMQDAEFQDLVRHGYTIIVEDCIPLDSQLARTTCADYARRFPNEHMKAEYTPGQAHVNLADNWHQQQKKTVSAKKHLSHGKVLSGPYVWHVKDETVDKKTKPELMSQFHIPYFLNISALNREEVKDSFEMWFTHENGGTQAHADAYCETTISAQLSGKKTWRYGTFPNISNAFERSDYHDGEIYKEPDEYWQPEHEHVVNAGECVVFPMGLIHETYVPEGEAGDHSCTVASTFQFQDPQPVYLWKNFLTRWGLAHYAMEEPCLERMEPYIYLGGRVNVKEDDEAKLREQIVQIFRKVDANTDGLVSLDELHRLFTTQGFRPPWTEVQRNRKLLKEVAAEKAAFSAQDALLYHDSDNDGKVSLEEFADSAMKFAIVQNRVRVIKSLKGRKKKNRDKLLEKERSWIRKYLCTDDDCPQLKQLENNFNGKRGRHHEL